MSPVREDMFGSAPLLMRAVTALVRPDLAARWSGVYPREATESSME